MALHVGEEHESLVCTKAGKEMTVSLVFRDSGNQQAKAQSVDTLLNTRVNTRVIDRQQERHA